MKKALCLILVLLMSLMFSAGAITAAAEELTFAMLIPGVHQFWDPVMTGFEEYCAAQGWKAITYAPTDAADQVAMVENLIAMGVDGFCIAATDSDTMTPYINKAIAENVKAICFETDCPNSDRLAYIGTYNYNAGRHMGYVISKNIPDDGSIIIQTGLPTQLSLQERIRGITDYLAEKTHITILDEASNQGDAETGISIAEQQTAAFPEFNAYIGIDATAGPAMIKVWKNNGWLGNTDHLIICFDDMEANLIGLRDGYVTAIVAQRQNTWGEGTAKILYDLVSGKELESTSVDTGSVEITLDNVDNYMSEPPYVEE